MIEAAILTLFGICSALFVFGSRRTRALLILMSIFVANLEIEVGIGLNLPVLLMILSTFLVMTGQIPIHPRAASLFSHRLLLFLCWTLGIWVIGFLSLEVVNNAHYGWTRSSTVKPIIQLVRFFLLVPFGLTIADGIRSTADLQWFLKMWTRIAVISALTCVLQVGAHKLTGQSLGTYRIHQQKFHLTFAKVGGMRILRANGLAGEPKAQGMAMAMSLCMLLATLGRGIMSIPRQRHLACVSLVSIALLLTFSSGAIAMAVILLGLVILGKESRSAKRIALAAVFFALAVATQFSSTASSFWESRLHRIVSITTDVHGHGWGMDKERPAMIYLLQHPHLATTGVGMGMGPFHFDHLITDLAFRGKYVDPNSGMLWGLYGFGLVGWLLLLIGLAPELQGRGVGTTMAPVAAMFLRFTLLYFLVYTPVWWLMIAIGITCAPGVQRKAAVRPVNLRATRSASNKEQRKLLHAT
jgi:hypothetical protein